MVGRPVYKDLWLAECKSDGWGVGGCRETNHRAGSYLEELGADPDARAAGRRYSAGPVGISCRQAREM